MKILKTHFNLPLRKIVSAFILSGAFSLVGFAQETNTFDCVRSVPAPIFKKSFYPKKTFTLRSNPSFPSEKIGTETIRFKNGDRLTVKNYGCENYSLDFRFVTGRFSGRIGDAEFWHRIAAGLLRQTIKALREPSLIADGAKAIEARSKKKRPPAFGEEIDFGGADIRSVATVGKPKKMRGNRFQIVISLGIGPL